MSLKEDMVSDLDTFFDVDEFAIKAKWEPEKDKFLEFSGNLTSGVEIAKEDKTGSSKAKSYQYRFDCKWSDVKTIKKNISLTIDGEKYLVAIAPFNQNGFAQIYMNKDHS